jgi:hypothetical protein
MFGIYAWLTAVVSPDWIMMLEYGSVAVAAGHCRFA